MIHLHIIWLGWLSLVKKILKLILPSLKSTKKDNEYVERTINKYRVKLKNNWNDKELRFINWIIKLINSKKLLPKTHRLSIAKIWRYVYS